MIESIKKETDGIVKKITDKFNVNKIILFGSYAYGNPDIDSDIDLCIILKENKRKMDLKQQIRVALKGSKHPIDILVYKPEEFDFRADSTTSMESQILKKGIILYG